MRLRSPFLLLTLAASLLAAGSGLAAAPAPLSAPQDPGNLKRLSSDQRKLAGQVRRLEKLLETLEQRERDSGNEARAQLLAGARERLHNSSDEQDLITLIESVSNDLFEMRSGVALEAQAKVIEQLEGLLDYLLERQRLDQMAELIEKARARREALESLARQQNELLQQTQRVQSEEERNRKADADARQSVGGEQRELNQKIRDFAGEERREQGEALGAEEAAEAGEEAADLLDPEGKGKSQAERAESEAEATKQEQAGEQNEAQDSEQQSEAGERSPSESQSSESKSGESSEKSPSGSKEEQNQSAAESEPSSEQQSPESQSPSGESSEPQERSPQERQQLDQAQEAQERAKEALEQAAEKARQEEESLREMQRREALINVMNEATRIKEVHVRVMSELRVFAEEADSRPSRSSRVQLRRWSSEEKTVSEDTASLQIEVREQGADSVPFLLSILREDHDRLSYQIGPPNYSAAESQLYLGDRLTELWDELIGAIREEAERDLPTFQQQGGSPGGQEQQDQPLVSFSAEVQLLKRLQDQLRTRMDRMVDKRKLLSEAGIPLDEGDIEEIDRLVDLQGRLRSIFESIISRLEEANLAGEGDDA